MKWREKFAVEEPNAHWTPEIFPIQKVGLPTKVSKHLNYFGIGLEIILAELNCNKLSLRTYFGCFIG